VNTQSISGTSPENNSCPEWGLRSDITPRFGARLVREGHRLHFLSDRAGFTGTFSDDDALRLEQAFPLLMKQLEQKLQSGELNPPPSGAGHAAPEWSDL
jgi:cytoskeleton bundling-enhancing protein CbeA-like protein